MPECIDRLGYGPAISAGDLLLVYLAPVVAAGVVLSLGTLVVWVLVRSPLEFDFKRDLERRAEMRRQTRSGANVRLSWPYIAGLLVADSTVQATWLYRVSRWLVAHRLRPFAQFAHALARFVTHADISPRAQIGPGLYLYHGLGVVIGKGTTIGRDALICQGVTLGGGPTVGDSVSIWAGAKIVGKVSIGDRAEVGANAVVIADVPADHVAVGVPATSTRRSDPSIPD